MMTEEQIKAAAKGVCDQRKRVPRTKRTAIDQAYAKSRYYKRSDIDSKVADMSDAQFMQEVWR